MIFWIPGTPKAQPRPSIGKRSGWYPRKSDRLTEPWRRAIRMAMSAKLRSGVMNFSGAVEIKLLFIFQRPKSHYRTGKNSHLFRKSAPLYHCQKPDVDNLAKLVLDEFQKLTLIGDDCQVVKLTTSKAWDTQKSGCQVKIEQASGLNTLSWLNEDREIDPR